MNLTLTLSEEEYPLLFQIYKKDREKKSFEIFKTGYNIHFPNVEDNSKNSEYHTILKSLEDMKYVVSNEGPSSSLMDSKLEELLGSIHKLTGINNNSSKRGEVGENMLEEIIKQRYGDILFESKAKTPHCGDAWLHLPDKKIIMLESKNYSSRISKDEVEKMEFDMKTNHIRFGIFVSWNSTVQSRNDIDIHTFNHSGETYMILIISNLCDDIIKLDLSFQVLRKLMENFYELKEFPWILNGIKENLNELDQIIQLNYKLRDYFYLLNTNIRNSLDSFYQNLRDYQYDINKKAQDIINKVEDTMKSSLIGQENEVEEIEFLSEFKESKLFTVLGKLHDVFINNNFSLEKDSDSNIKIIKDGDDVGNIKIQKKKIILSLFKFNIFLELDSVNYLDSIPVIIPIFKNI